MKAMNFRYAFSPDITPSHLARGCGIIYQLTRINRDRGAMQGRSPAKTGLIIGIVGFDTISETASANGMPPEAQMRNVH